MDGCTGSGLTHVQRRPAASTCGHGSALLARTRRNTQSHHQQHAQQLQGAERSVSKPGDASLPARRPPCLHPLDRRPPRPAAAAFCGDACIGGPCFPPPPPSPINDVVVGDPVASAYCGDGAVGTGVCLDASKCCSMWGHCGTGFTYCSADRGYCMVSDKPGRACGRPCMAVPASGQRMSTSARSAARQAAQVPPSCCQELPVPAPLPDALRWCWCRCWLVLLALASMSMPTRPPPVESSAAGRPLRRLLWVRSGAGGRAAAVLRQLAPACPALCLRSIARRWHWAGGLSCLCSVLSHPESYCCWLAQPSGAFPPNVLPQPTQCPIPSHPAGNPRAEQRYRHV